MGQPKGKKPKHATPRQAATKIVRVLRQAGHTAYFAGGCVRDALLGTTPKDYDIATDAPPQRVLGLFRNARYVGEAFGVVRVRLMRHDVEVATFRLESYYVDGRRPSQVRFTDARHDAQRRDFTVNGLFEDPLRRSKADRIIDYVGGVADLQRRVIRAIGDPRQRFAEDYLRMLRAVRFAARLEFRIGPRTGKAIVPLADRLGRISRERIGLEVAAMLSASASPQRAEAVRLIQRLHLDAPTLNEPHADPPASIVTALDDQAGYPTVLAAWMLDRHPRKSEPRPRKRRTTQPGQMVPELSPETIDDLAETQRRWRRALCLSNDDRDSVRQVLRLTAELAKWVGLGLARRKRLLADPLWRQAFLLLEASHDAAPGAEPARLAAVEREAAALIAEGVAPQPWVNGDDLIAMGRKPGPQFSRLLTMAYDAQLDGSVRSRAEALAYVRAQG